MRAPRTDRLVPRKGAAAGVVEGGTDRGGRFWFKARAPGVPGNVKKATCHDKRPGKKLHALAGRASGLRCAAGRLVAGGSATADARQCAGSDAGDWLDASVLYALAEARSPRPGGHGVLSKLAEVLFIEVLWQYGNDHHEGRTGWLASLSDRIVCAAWSALHARRAFAWTLDDLARESGTSRSVLAERFQQLVGSSPIAYLTQWRMLLAANPLRRSTAPLSRLEAPDRRPQPSRSRRLTSGRQPLRLNAWIRLNPTAIPNRPGLKLRLRRNPCAGKRPRRPSGPSIPGPAPAIAALLAIRL